MKTSSQFPRILIIGGGFGGIQITKKLKDKEVEVVMIDRHNYHTFQPLLYQVATGGLEPDSIAFPLRKIFKNQKNFKFRVAEAQQIVPEKNTLKTSIGDFEYDYLVLATGSETNFFGQDEVEHNSMPMKSIPEALNLRSLILQNFEEAVTETDPKAQEALMNFVVVGAGPTGVETAGALAELKAHVLPKDYPELDISKMHIYLVEGVGKVLPPMSEEASAKSKDFLEKMGVHVLLNTMVESYDGQYIRFKGGKEIHTKSVIWSAGVKGAIVPGLDKAEVVRGGKLKVDNINRVAGYENIFAIGDLAHLENEKFPKGHPGVAQVAIQQGQQLGKNFLNIINGNEAKPFSYFDKGSMATIGRNKAVVDLSFWKFQGFFAWLTWMFIHLLFLVGFRNKVVTFINWVINYFSYDRGNRLIIRPFDRKSMEENPLAK